MQAIDWSAAWLGGWREFGEPASSSVAEGVPVHEALNCQKTVGTRFVCQIALPFDEPYERYIFTTSTVPTRDNLHDFFNGLCWLRFPQTKRRLNQLQAAEIEKAGIQPLRGAVRDALTVFDENAAFLLAPQPLWDALLARDWQRLFISLRPLWQEAQLVLFGHALLEKLVYPRKHITAHVYQAQPAINSIAELDGWIAGDLHAPKLARKPFTPLPVLGVPGWWPGNEDLSFYDDISVFRPRREGENRQKNHVRPLQNPYKKLDLD
ncbi:MAG: hypothetical protein JWR68_1149 [Polaromonas sp.]|nr:hypothetical protein [Polaromonas sp.]